MPTVWIPEAFLVYLAHPTIQIYYIPATLTLCKVTQILESEKFLLVNPESTLTLCKVTQILESEKFFLVNPESTLTLCKVTQILESEKFLLVNPESWALESKIQH